MDAGTRLRLLGLAFALLLLSLEVTPVAAGELFCEEEGQTPEDIYDLCIASSGPGAEGACFLNSYIYWCTCVGGEFIDDGEFLTCEYED